MSLLVLTWDEFDQAVAALAGMVPADALGIYGPPRGGLPLAVALSHRTGLPVLREQCDGMFVVDDIQDSGKAMAEAMADYNCAGAATWVRRFPTAKLDLPCYRSVLDDAWVVFPWECLPKANNEREEYAARQ